MMGGPEGRTDLMQKMYISVGWEDRGGDGLEAGRVSVCIGWENRGEDRPDAGQGRGWT